MSGSASPEGSNQSGEASSELYPSLRQLPRLAVPYADLYRRVRIQETVFELLSQQYEMARIEEAKDTPVVAVIDQPLVAEKKSFPPRTLVTLLLTMLAVRSNVLLHRSSFHVGARRARRSAKSTRAGNWRNCTQTAGAPLSAKGWCRMRAHLSNAAYGVLDYAAYPIAMILSAPTLLKHLGVEQYGIWIVTTAALNTGSIIASGFGDANIQYIASARSQGECRSAAAGGAEHARHQPPAGRSARAHFVDAGAARSRPPGRLRGRTRAACLLGLRIASVLMLVRAIETVCVSTQRAFERYGAAIRISLFTRVITVAAAVVLSIRGFGVAGIMEATACFLVLGTLAQLIRLQQYLGAASLLPSFDRHATTALFQFGAFSWLLAVSSVIFTQADRLLLGVSLGATTVTAYALCVQMAQPIYGIASSGLHFLFPYLPARNAVSRPAAIRKAVLVAFSVNLLIVAVGTGSPAALWPCGP